MTTIMTPQDVLIEHHGVGGTLNDHRLSRERWEQQTGGSSSDPKLYWDWVVQTLYSTAWVGPEQFQVPEPSQVTLPQGPGTWQFEGPLFDEESGLNLDERDGMPTSFLLFTDTDLLEVLHSQMTQIEWAIDSDLRACLLDQNIECRVFAAKLNGKLGTVFEAQYYSKESWHRVDSGLDVSHLPTQADLDSLMLVGLKQAAAKYSLDMCLPNPSMLRHLRARPAVAWAFFPLPEDQAAIKDLYSHPRTEWYGKVTTELLMFRGLPQPSSWTW